MRLWAYLEKDIGKQVKISYTLNMPFALTQNYHLFFPLEILWKESYQVFLSFQWDLMMQ